MPAPRPITHIIIHCAASPNGAPIDIQLIDRWHQARGFKRHPDWMALHQPHLAHVGYHFLIRVDGVVESGRDVREVGAHCKGHNANSIGICLAGTSRYSVAQWNALAQLVQDLQRSFPGARAVGHRDLSDDLDKDGTVEAHEWTKTCPGFYVKVWLHDGMKPQPAALLP